MSHGGNPRGPALQSTVEPYTALFWAVLVILCFHWCTVMVQPTERVVKKRWWAVGPLRRWRYVALKTGRRFVVPLLEKVMWHGDSPVVLPVSDVPAERDTGERLFPTAAEGHRLLLCVHFSFRIDDVNGYMDDEFDEEDLPRDQAARRVCAAARKAAESGWALEQNAESAAAAAAREIVRVVHSANSNSALKVTVRKIECSSVVSAQTLDYCVSGGDQ